MAALLCCAGLGILATCAVQAAERPEFDNAAETTHKTLSWSDFKSKKAKVTRWGGAWAHCALSLRLTRAKSPVKEDAQGASWIAHAPKLTAYSIFDKYLSAVAPGARKDSVLAHEQLHFDLSEAFALNLTLEIRQLEARDISASSARLALNSAIEESFNKTKSELLAMQQRYDDEADHGSKRKKQAAWAKVITEMLEAARRTQTNSS